MNGQINLGELKPFNYFIGIAVIVGLMFAFISPDSELAYGWLGHILQWQIQTIVPMLLALAAIYLLGKVSFLNTINPWFKLLISGLCACLLTTPFALLSDVLLANQPLEHNLTASLLHEFAALTPPVLVCWIAINAPFQFGWQLQKKILEYEPKDAKTNEMPNFFSLLPTELQGDVIYLKSELQYLKIVTMRGKTLILYSLKSAIEELSSTDGVQPHRSYWVNSAHINNIKKQGRQGEIILSNGDLIPISRAKLQDVMVKLATETA